MHIIAIAAALTAAAPDTSVHDSVSPSDDEKPAWAAGFGFDVGIGFFTEPFRGFVEHRFGDRVWLGIGAEAGAEVSHVEASGVAFPPSTSIAVGASAGLEGRFVLNPGDPLEISALGEVSAGVQSDLGPGATTVANADVGIAVEHWFTPTLAVRLSSSVIGVGGSFESQGGETATSLSGGIRFAPSLAALVAF